MAHPATMVFYIAFIALIFGACLYAWRRGGGPERAVAGLFAAAWLLSTVSARIVVYMSQGTGAGRFRTVGYHTLAIDVLLLIGLLAVSRRANRAWPVVVAGLQTLIVLAHVARMASPHQFGLVYMIMTQAWPYLQVLILIAGIALHWRRTVTQGAEPSWKN
ncbi:hypothetical protein ACFQ1E_16980 [Sphingomonas canadensis]|uniref:Uncharacterized protein n=1 Tax=Sphingomonas canadensis TaxID=1219257 RepID=A0ABW3HBH6_9SPHN|nr:hypothetical protein [Sphingomonas canadensis]MCW3837741.1 hypothetical protein [Sphingomonas canadensis]